MNCAFVIGNGRSRLGLDLNSLRGQGKIFGCNALYRDFSPDVLVATDPAISDEIEKSDYPSNHIFYTRKPRHSNSKLIPMNYGYSSGPVAITLAAMEGYRDIYLIGFDLRGINGKFNNVYSGTPCYKKTDSDETYYGNWVNQIFSISRQFNVSNYYKVGDDKQFFPTVWKKKQNISPITIDEFCQKINNISWQKQKE